LILQPSSRFGIAKLISSNTLNKLLLIYELSAASSNGQMESAFLQLQIYKFTKL